jgi:hypothetical protein
MARGLFAALVVAESHRKWGRRDMVMVHRITEQRIGYQIIKNFEGRFPEIPGIRGFFYPA